jgi:putative serine protease PepD
MAWRDDLGKGRYKTRDRKKGHTAAKIVLAVIVLAAMAFVLAYFRVIPLPFFDGPAGSAAAEAGGESGDGSSGGQGGGGGSQGESGGGEVSGGEGGDSGSQGGGSSTEEVAAKVTPSVVFIGVYLAEDSRSDADSLEQGALGSGVIISSDGYIVTNYHVIEGASRLMAHVGGSTWAEAYIVGSDPASDIAVIKIDADGLTAIEVASSADVVVGNWVMAVGSPFGLENSVSAGIVSALNRSASAKTTGGQTINYSGLIQTDAAINPGNSGGALVDSSGRLIGINTLIATSSGSNSDLGFAIPSNQALEIARSIIGKSS